MCADQSYAISVWDKETQPRWAPVARSRLFVFRERAKLKKMSREERIAGAVK